MFQETSKNPTELAITNAINLLQSQGICTIPCETHLLSEVSEEMLPYQLLSTNDIIFYALGAGCCMTMGGLAAGLTMGFSNLNPLDLAVKLKSGSKTEIKQAERLVPLLERHHLTLVTLLLYNSFSSEALPIFLNKLLPEYMAVVFSVVVVLFFGEIFPSAIFVGAKGLTICSGLTPFVNLLTFLAYPIGKPIAMGLDYFLGHDNHGITKYNRKELQI